MNCWFSFKTGKRSFSFGGPIIISFQFSGVRRFEGDDHMALTEVSEIISFHFSA